MCDSQLLPLVALLMLSLMNTGGVIAFDCGSIDQASSIPVLELGDLLLVVRPQPVVRAHRLGELLQPRLKARHLETNIAFRSFA